MLGLGRICCRAARAPVNAITMASDTSQPKMNPAPFLTPPTDARIKMKAVA